MSYRETDWSHTPTSHGHTELGFYFHLGTQLGETNTHLQALRWEVHDLPERIAQQMAPHLAPSNGLTARVTRLTQLLQSGMPYVQLIKRTAIVIALWTIAAAGNYSPEQIKDLLVKVSRAFLGL